MTASETRTLESVEAELAHAHATLALQREQLAEAMVALDEASWLTQRLLRTEPLTDLELDHAARALELTQRALARHSP